MQQFEFEKRKKKGSNTRPRSSFWTERKAQEKEEKRSRLLALKAQGLTDTQIGFEVGLSCTTVGKWIRKLEAE